MSQVTSCLIFLLRRRWSANQLYNIPKTAKLETYHISLAQFIINNVLVQIFKVDWFEVSSRCRFSASAWPAAGSQAAPTTLRRWGPHHPPSPTPRRPPPPATKRTKERRTTTLCSEKLGKCHESWYIDLFQCGQLFDENGLLCYYLGVLPVLQTMITPSRLRSDWANTFWRNTKWHQTS